MQQVSPAYSADPEYESGAIVDGYLEPRHKWSA